MLFHQRHFILSLFVYGEIPLFTDSQHPDYVYAEQQANQQIHGNQVYC
jgi:hypothetical protein